MRISVLSVCFFVCSALFGDTHDICTQLQSEILKPKPSENFKITDEILSCDGSSLRIQELQNLLKITKVIRGHGANCDGEAAFERDLDKLEWKLLKASYDPQGYAKTLAKPELAEAQKDAQSAYFRYWAHQSFYNYQKFQQFWSEFNQAQTPLVKFYEAKNMDTQSAAYYATSVLNEFLNYAVGSYPEDKKLDISDAQKAMLDKKAGYETLLGVIYAKKYTPKELESLLKTALLANKNESIIAEILKMSQGLNLLESGDENALFFALGSHQNVKFLLSKNVNVNHKNAIGKTALFDAVELKDAALVKLLLASGANANDSYIDDASKNAALNLGVSLPFYMSLCALEHTNKSVFMHAAAHSTPEILQILLDSAADASAFDDLGFNALDHAQKAQNEPNVEFLQKLGLKNSE